MPAFALFVVLAVVPALAAGADADEAQASQRLEARALDAVDSVLGPGHAKVHVEVQGDRSVLLTETEMLSVMGSSVSSGTLARLLDLPGYVKGSRPADAAGKESPGAESSGPFQKDHEQTRRDSGFQVRSIQATVVLDTALDDAAVREVSQLLPQILRIDATRGDVLSLLRAPMKPAWKTAFSTPSDLRRVAYAAGFALVLLFGVLLFGGFFVRAARVLGSELSIAGGARRRDAPLGEVEPLPELMPGAPPGLLDAGASAGGASGGTVPLLGRRFDFLSAREPALVAKLLSGFKPEELSLLFGHLSASFPETASRLFSRLPADVQAEVSQSLLGLTTSDPERLSALEEKLRLAVENGLEGPQSLARILSRVPGEERDDLLGRLAERDRRGVEEVERHVFSFEDLARVAPGDLLRLMGAVPYELWGTALRAAPQTLADRVLSELPDGPRQLVRETIAKPQSKDKVASARSQVLDAFSALAARGEVSGERVESGGDLM